MDVTQAASWLDRTHALPPSALATRDARGRPGCMSTRVRRVLSAHIAGHLDQFIQMLLSSSSDTDTNICSYVFRDGYGYENTDNSTRAFLFVPTSSSRHPTSRAERALELKVAEASGEWRAWSPDPACSGAGRRLGSAACRAAGSALSPAPFLLQGSHDTPARWPVPISP